MTNKDTITQAFIDTNIEFTTVNDNTYDYVKLIYTGRTIQGFSDVSTTFVFDKDGVFQKVVTEKFTYEAAIPNPLPTPPEPPIVE